MQINIYLHNHVLSQVVGILKAFFHSIPLSHSSLYQCFYWHNPVFMSGSPRQQINFRNHSILDILMRTSSSVVCSAGNMGYFQNPTSCSFVLNNLVSIFSSSCSSHISLWGTGMRGIELQSTSRTLLGNIWLIQLFYHTQVLPFQNTLSQSLNEFFTTL